MIEIVTDPIDESVVLNSVKSKDAGACVLFVGTTRRITGDQETVSLTYEAYDEMATKELTRLRQLAAEKWPLTACSIVHRVGKLPPGETSVVVAVSCPHRVDAFESASWIMDTLKKKVPIWKKETWSDGSEAWIHPVNDTHPFEERT